MNLGAFSLILVLAFVLLAAFATLNWAAMAAPSTLSLGFVEVTAPLGMIMLVFTAAITACSLFTSFSFRPASSSKRGG